MAITWDTKITPIDITNNVASVQGTRTDSEDAENPRTYNVPRAVIDTPAQKLAVMDEIWAKHQAGHCRLWGTGPMRMWKFMYYV